MIGHISLAEKVDADFSYALRKALLRRVGALAERCRAGIAAGVGALLQGRLAAAIQDEATWRAGQLPSEFCDWFLDGFRQGTRGGLEFGTNQAGGGVQATPGIPARVAEQLEQLAEGVFKNAFVEAMHLTLILPIAVVLLAVISCFAVGQGKVKTRLESMEQVEDAA